MKKTFSISIARRLFNLEEDAYQKLDQYLSAIKHHFDQSADKKEIIADIEERIAEHFLESKTGIITLEDVESLVKTMGTVEQFEQSDEASEEKAEKQPRRLYRDTDDMVLAGVSSGLGHYFAIDPIIFRIIFAASVFAGGTGIFIYAALWYIMPEAKTASQKLSMHGNPINLGTLSETVKDRINELKGKDTSKLQRLLTLPFRIVGNIIRFLMKFLGKLVGFGLSVAGSIVLVGTVIAAGFLSFGDILMFENVTLQAFIPGLLRHVLVLGLALTVMIPALFAFLGGISLMRKKSAITSHVGWGLLGLWLVALSISSYGVAKSINRYDTFVATSPTYQTISQTEAITGVFSGIELQDGILIELVPGTTTSMVIEGRAKEINAVKAEVINGILTIERERINDEQLCLFCFSSGTSITLTLPASKTLTSLSIAHGSSLSGNLPATENLELDIENGSRATLDFNVENLTARVTHGSRLTAAGEATVAMVTLENGSVFEGEDLIITDTTINAIHGSRADIHVLKTLDATAKNGSVIYYTGDPEVTKSESNGSIIEPRD